MISLISKFSGITVVWVDDRAELTDEDITKIVENDEYKPVDLAPLNQIWADAVLSGYGSELPSRSLTDFASAASILMKVCAEFRAIHKVETA